MPKDTMYTYELPSGATIEFENLSEARRGATDVSKRKDRGRVAIEKVIEPLGELAGMMIEKLMAPVRVPATVTLEFTASLKGQTSLVIVSGETQGSIKVKLTWEKPENSKTPPTS